MNNGEERAQTLGNAVAQRIEPYGLKPIQPLRVAKSNTDGWYVKIASWRNGRRPNVILFYDRVLEHYRQEFWFGFQSRATIGKIVEALPPRFQKYALIGDQKHWTDRDAENERLDAAMISQIRKHNGLVYDQTDNTGGGNYFALHESGLKYKTDDELADRAASFIIDVVEAVDPFLAEEQDVAELKKLEEPNERATMIMARRGQGEFRRNVEQIWGYKCAVYGCESRAALRASHIKPWKKCETREEKLDGNNGLLLTATLDALFDKGLISFHDTGEIIISSHISPEDQKLLSLKELRLSPMRPLSEKQKIYLGWHRTSILRK